MGIFQRIMRLFRSNVNNLISKAEEPEKILDQVVVDMREQLNDAKRQVAVAIADEKKLKKQWTNELQQSDAWERKAMRAIQMGDDGLAKDALARKAKHDQTAEEYQKQWDLQRAAVEQIKGALFQLSQKIEEAERKKDLLIARKKRAEAQQTIQSTMTGLSDNSAFETLERMVKKVEQMEAEAAAHAELNQELMEDRSLDARFQALEDQHHDQDDALAALKAKMGISQATETVAEKVHEKEKERVAVGRDEERW